MSSIDQAFIKAYSDGQTPVASYSRESVSHRQERGVPGPHANFSAGPKRPLSEAMAARDQPAPEPRRSPVSAGTTVASFTWPAVVGQLAEQCEGAYRRMVTYATRAGGVVGFLGVAEGAGCTTTVLAAALAAGRGGLRVAMIDADARTMALAQSLGFLHARSLAEAIAVSAPPSDAVIHSAADNASLAVAFGADEHAAHDPASSPAVSEALRGLTAGHTAVLVDLGSDADALADGAPHSAERLALDAVILVRRAGGADADVARARRALADAGHAVVGVVDSFAAA